jgi:hypothetical protein
LRTLPPAVERFCVDSQGEMAWPAGPMRRQLVAFQRGFGQEATLSMSL